LPRHRAVIIRTAGNQLSERTRDELRSIAVALFVKQAREILVVGHTDCGMSTFSAADVAEAFRKAGIPRSAFGDEDLRIWFGAFGSVRDNVMSSTSFLRKSAVVPRDTKIHGLLLDTNNGTLEVVVDGDETLETPAAPAAAPAPDATAPESLTAEAKETPPVRPVESTPALPAQPAMQATPPVKKGPVIVGQGGPKAEPAVARPSSLLEAALILRDFLHRERQNKQVQKTIADRKALWKQERNPYGVFTELQKTAQAYQAQYPRLPGALRYLEEAIRSGHADKIGFGEIIKRILD
jgi:hypothetical protein